MTGINVGTKVPCRSAFQVSLVCFLCITLGHLEVLGYMPQINVPRTGITTPSKSTTTPYFDDISRREIKSLEGQTVIIPCTVRNLSQEKVVSWIRTRDLHILTSGPHTFSGDYRFEAVHTDDLSNEDFWGLRIRGVKADDAGQYECQVNTEPKMSLAYKLIVTGLASNGSNSKWLGYAKIKGPKEVFVQLGTPYYISCEITSSFTRHVNFDVWWLHEDTQILFQIKEARISTQTTYNKDQNVVRSILSLHHVSWQDSGTYSCLQPSVKKDSMRLVVVEAETSEAMQRDFPATAAAAASLCPTRLDIFLFLSINSYFLLFY